MPNSGIIVLIFGLVMTLILVLGALWGFLAGLKRELKCLIVFVVVLGLSWVIFGTTSSIDDNIILGLSGIIRGMFNVPSHLNTWKEVGIYIGQNNLGLNEILVEGTKTYSLYLNVISMVVKGCYLILGTIIAFVLSGVVRLISHIVELIIKIVKNKKIKDSEENIKPKKKLSDRLYGAGVGLFKNILIVILICAPITTLTGVVQTLDDESKDTVEEIMLGANIEGSQIDWVFDVVEALDDSAFISLIKSTDSLFGKSLDESIFDTMFNVQTDHGVVYLEAELTKLIDIIDIVLPTYDKTKQIPFDVWSLNEEEIDSLVACLKESNIFKAILPVAFEFVGQMDNIQIFLNEAGLYNLNDFVKQVDWEQDLDLLLDLVKQFLLGIDLNKPINIMGLNSSVLQNLIITLSETTFFSNLMPIVLNVALSLTVVENFLGEFDNADEITNNLQGLNWKNELVNLIDIYGLLQKLNIDLANANLNWLVDVINNEESFGIIKDAVSKLTSGELFSKVMMPVLDQFIDTQIAKNGLGEFEGLFSVLKMESSDWNHDLPIVLEMVGILSKMGVLSNNIRINDFDSMHELVDKLFELIILSDKVKVSVDNVDLKTLLVEAAIRQFKILDIEEVKFELIELRDEIDWKVEEENIHKLIDTFAGFLQTVKNLQGIDVTSLADLAGLNFNILLNAGQFWDDVFDLLDSLVNSKLVMSLLPQVFEKFISPIILGINADMGNVGLLDGITSKNVIAEIYNLVYIAMDLKQIGIFDAQARLTFDYHLGANAYVPEEGFYESEYFTYTPNASDLALVDIIERIFTSTILNGREGRLIKVLLKMTLGVDVSADELMAINYSNTVTRALSEKQILISGINQLRPIFDDPDFSIFVTDEAGLTSLNINYFLEQKNLTIILSAVRTLLNSQIIICTVPEVYNQLLVAKGIIPADFAEILTVQSTFLGKTDGITKEELNEDIHTLLDLVQKVAENGILDILNAEKNRNVEVNALGVVVIEALDVLVGLNILEDKLDDLVLKVLKNTGIDLDTSMLVDLDWELELKHVKEILKDAVELVVLSGLATYGDVLDFLTTSPMDISRFYHSMTVYLVGTITLELYNSQVLYELVYGFLFNKILASSPLKDQFHLSDYTSEYFRQDLLIVSDMTYQLVYTGLIPVVGSIMFPAKYDGVYDVDLGNHHIAYLIEDALSLNVINLNLYSITETLFKSFGLTYDLADLLGVRLVNDLNNGVESLWDQEVNMQNAFSTYNQALKDSDLYFEGDAAKFRKLYIALTTIFNGPEFPIKDSNAIKNFGAVFTADVINAYKNSDYLNNYALAIADVLDIFSEMTMGKALLTPIVTIVDKMNIDFGGTKLSKFMEFRPVYTKDDMLADISNLGSIIRDAVGFDLIYIFLRDHNIEWINREEYAVALIEDIFDIRLLDANFNELFNIIVSMMTGGNLQIALARDVDLSGDGVKLGKAYHYIAKIMQNNLGIVRLSSLNGLIINLANFLLTENAKDVVLAVREAITISMLEAVLPDLSVKMQNTNLHYTLKELLSLDGISSLEVLESIEDVTYPIVDLLDLNILDILLNKDISLVGIDTLPDIVERILSNKYIDVKHGTLLELARLMFGVSEMKFDAYAVNWDNEVEHIKGMVQDFTDVIVNCNFQTLSQLMQVIVAPASAKQYFTIPNLEEAISVVRHLINLETVEGLGLGFYEEKFLPVIKPNMQKELYNLIMIDNAYQGSELLGDIELLLQVLETIIYTDLLPIWAQDKEIDYVGLTPAVSDIIEDLFTLNYLTKKVEYLYDFIKLIIPNLDTTWIDYKDIDLVNDAVKLGSAYEAIAPFLDSAANPYQRLSMLKQPATINLGMVTTEEYIGVVNALKQINDTTIFTKNSPLFLTVFNNILSNYAANNRFCGLLYELCNLPFNNNEYKTTVQNVHDDINTILDTLVIILDNGLIEFLHGEDINIILNEPYEQVLRNVWGLKNLDGKYGTAINLFGELFGINLSGIDENILNADADIELLIQVMNDILDLLEENDITTIVKLINYLKYPETRKEYLTTENVRILANITSDAIGLSILEATLPTLLNAFAEKNVVPNARELFTMNSDYTYSDLVNDYTEFFHPVINDLLDFGMIDILKDKTLVIEWDKEKEPDVYYISVIIRQLLSTKYMDAKKEAIYNAYFIKKLVGMSKDDIEAIDMTLEAENFVNAYEALIPLLISEEWPYKTYETLLQLKPSTFEAKGVLTQTNTQHVINALRAFEESFLLESILGPYFSTLKLNSEIASWLSFEKIIEENDELGEYGRVLDILELLNELNYIEADYSAIDTVKIVHLIDLIFGNETLDNPIQGLKCIVDQGKCIITLYTAGLIPQVEGALPQIDNVEPTNEAWHKEILILRNFVAATGEFGENGIIDLPNIMTTILKSTNVTALEEVFTYMNESILYRDLLYRALYDVNKGTLSTFLTVWFTEQVSGMKTEADWRDEVIILARLQATINHIGGEEGADGFDLTDFMNMNKGYKTGDAGDVNTPYVLVPSENESAGLRQLYQLIEASKSYEIAEPLLKAAIEAYLAL